MRRRCSQPSDQPGIEGEMINDAPSEMNLLVLRHRPSLYLDTKRMGIELRPCDKLPIGTHR